jgi:GAF domain-containing protein
VTDGERQSEGLLGWVRERLRKLVDKAADNLLWLLLLALAGAGSSILGVLQQALEYRALLIAVGTIVFVLALALVVLASVKRSRDERRLLQFELATSEYEKQLLYEILETVQESIAAGNVALNDLVERGILGPVRGLLTRSPFEDVRLAVLCPRDDDPDTFRMRCAAGHRPQSVQQYRRGIDDTMAGLAYRTGEFIESPDVDVDPRFVPNPRASRPFRSLVAVPLRVGDEIVGALSVVSTESFAFPQTDVAFIKAIGAALDVVFAFEAAGSNR